MTKQPNPTISQVCEAYVGAKRYVVRVTNGAVVIIHDGAEYARGYWVEFGGFVRYMNDGAASTYNWHVFDAVDVLLRRELKWKPYRANVANMSEVLSLLAQRRGENAVSMKLEGA